MQSFAMPGNPNQDKEIFREIMEIKVTIGGLSPLLMNRFVESSEVKISSGTSSSMQSGSKGTPREQAEVKAYRDEDTGELYLPGPNLMRAIINAGIFHKVGKRQLTTQKSSLIPAFLQVVEIVIPLDSDKWEVDSRSVVIPSTGGRIMCHRPRCDKWKCTFHLSVDENGISENLARTLVDDAGMKIGLCDFRPERKGPFGRFKVVNWIKE
jgi:hypothetical protein